MIASAANFRSLLSSGGVYVIGNSLLGIMLPLRMEAEGFSIFLIGIVMTGRLYRWLDQQLDEAAALLI